MAIPKACTFIKNDKQWDVRCTFPDRKMCSPYLKFRMGRNEECRSRIIPGIQMMFAIDSKELPASITFGDKANIESVTILDKDCDGYTDIDVAIKNHDDKFVLVLQPAAISTGSPERLPGRPMSLVVADLASYKKVLVGAADVNGDNRKDIILKLTDKNGEVIHRAITNNSKHDTTCISNDMKDFLNEFKIDSKKPKKKMKSL